MRVIAYFMHEHEEQAALNILGNPTATDSYVLGDIAESDIPQLESAGLTVGRLDDVRSETSAMARGRLTGRSAVPEADGDAEVLDVAPGDRASWIVQLGEPLVERYREEIASTGVELQRSVPVNAYIAAATESQAGQLANLDFVVSVDRYGPRMGAPVRLRAGESPAPPTAGEPKTATDGRVWDLRLAETPGARESVMAWLESHEASSGLRLVASASHRIRLKIPEGSPLETEIPQLPDVLDMVEYVPPKLCNDLAVRLMGIVPDGAGSSGVPFTGKGQIVAVADTGLDQTHPDFQGRIVGVVALGRPGDSDDPDGHGTHVAGSVLGDGSASQGQIRGAAPEAKLYFQSIMDAAGNLGGLPLSLADLFEPAYQAGARIHSNSWGAATQSAYTIDSDDVDSYVHQRRDMLVVIAAGNEGTAGVRLNSPKGFVDWASIGSPGSCKNALTVGASRSDRTSGGFSQATYNSLWPGDYPDPPIGADRVSGDPESLAAFSSRGPCDDFRIKPELMAPGTDILSARSSLAPSNHFWGLHPQNPRYAYMGGTSMATPLASGCAALVRQYYADRRSTEPSAALVKATLINGARTLSGPDSTAKFPYYQQGFGAIHMPTTLPHDGAADFDLEFVDTWQKPAKQFQRTGERKRFNVTAGSATPFRLCLAYTDLPGRGLQNDISVIVQAPDGTKHAGNAGLPNPLIGSDCTNNVEVVRIDAPPAGTYLIQVFARNLLAGPQDFALVVTGDLNGPIAQLAN
ncbi:S8 family serine peptidase [Streptomyces sp. NPDC032472]|uniref:S8 family serine peptidase n=1 Tax=Streptomyces sp. NPDC032472 TaxID=3155018 RepID=UPI0033C44AAC